MKPNSADFMLLNETKFLTVSRSIGAYRLHVTFLRMCNEYYT